MVGLAGGVGSGKSTVARMLGELGAGVISSDQLGHEEINAADVKRQLVQWWGPSVLTADGAVDRRRVAAIVFGDPSLRRRLESLLHPRIAIRRSELMSELDAQPRVRMIVIDSPLLYETDLDLLCDAVIFVDASPEIRKDRSEKLRHWPEGELSRREKSQQPLDMKRARADYICENNSSLADLRIQVETIYRQIISEFGTA